MGWRKGSADWQSAEAAQCDWRSWAMNLDRGVVRLSPAGAGAEGEKSHQDLPSIPIPLLPLRQQWVAHSACIFSIRWETARPLELKRVCSSVVEQETLNLLVVGSTPTEPTIPFLA